MESSTAPPAPDTRSIQDLEDDDYVDDHVMSDGDDWDDDEGDHEN